MSATTEFVVARVEKFCVEMLVSTQRQTPQTAEAADLHAQLEVFALAQVASVHPAKVSAATLALIPPMTRRTAEPVGTAALPEPAPMEHVSPSPPPAILRCSRTTETSSQNTK